MKKGLKLLWHTGTWKNKILVELIKSTFADFQSTYLFFDNVLFQ